LFSLSLLLVTSLHAVPRIECDETKYDFGTMLGQEEIIHKFILWNRGNEPLEIIKIKDCCGVKSTVVPMTIPPGSNAVCISVLTTKGRYGKQIKKIRLVTNDRKNRYFDLHMTGILQKPVEFSPRYIRLGEVGTNSIVAETISATNLLNQVVTLDSVSTTVQGLEAVIIESNDRNWTIQLKSCDPLAVGRIQGRLQLNFSAGTMYVPIIGDVKPATKATP
jgi:hypothetical protein